MQTPKFILKPGKGKERGLIASSSSPSTRQQFVTPPRFISSTARSIAHEPELAQSSSSITLHRLYGPVKQADVKESIEEVDQDLIGWRSDKGEADVNEQVLPHPHDADSCAFNQLSPRLPKRRRLGSVRDPAPDPIIISSSDAPTSSLPPSPTFHTRALVLTPPRSTPVVSKHPRFLLSGLRPSSPPPSLPKFYIPAVPNPPPALPATFSPSRASQKYVPNGLASSLRDIVIETASQVSYLAWLRARADKKTSVEIWDFRFQVAEARQGEIGQGLVLVRDSRGKGWALIGKGKGDGKDAVSWKECEVRVRKPVWEVDLLGERWTVGTEWEVSISE